VNHHKALPGRRKGQRGRWGGGGMGRRRQRRDHRRWRRGLSEASRKEVTGWWDNAGWEGAQVDWSCRCRGSFRGRIGYGFSDERRSFLDEYRRKEESRLTFFRKLVEALHRTSRLGEQALHAALQHNSSLCFIARVATVLPAQGELPGLNSHALIWVFG